MKFLCLICAEAVMEHVLATHRVFSDCPGCGKAYWPGSHADRMLERMSRLRGRRGPG